MRGALEGVKVLDLTQYQAGPTTTMMLGDLGAEIIKIEPPWGEPMRFTYPIADGESVYFLALNRNKKSLTLNLKSEKGIKIFKELTKLADVVVENFSAGTMDSLGIGYEPLKEVNPKIVFASISGFGQYGPYKDRRSFDIIAQAMSGIMTITAQNVKHLTGAAEVPPILTAEAIGDSIPGIIAAVSILAALYSRERTGLGQKVDVAQMDSLIYVIPSIVPYFLTGLTLPQLREKYSAGVYGVFKAKDGYIAIASPVTLMDRLRKVLNRESVDEDVVKEWLKDKTTDEVVETLLKANIPVAPIRELSKVVTDPQVQAREMIVEVDHPKLKKLKVSGIPMKLSETSGRVELPPPLVGQHTEEILSKLLGYSSEEIRKLKEEEAI